MEFSTYKFKDTFSGSQLIQAYRNQDAKINYFYQFNTNIEGLKNAITRRDKFPVNREVLVKVLQEQNNVYFDDFPVIEKNIQLLSKENTYTVTTGHQLNLISGPAYFFYKILNTIELAQSLNAQIGNDNQFVPVFWMATEDHDFEEISTATLFGQKFKWEAEHKGPVGRINPNVTSDLIEAILEQFGSQEQDTFCARIIKEAYQKSTLSEATRHIVISFLGKYGVVVLDADHAELKKEFSSRVKSEIFDNTAAKAWQKSTDSLEELGFSTQLHIRDINVFYMLDDYRERIVFENKKYATSDNKYSWSKEELENEINNFPEKFSPNAAMRPVYQETILPNLAYIGGGGEIGYWLQLKSGFDALNSFYPVVFVRNSIFFLDNGALKKMRKLNIEFLDFFHDVHQLEAQIAVQTSENDSSLIAELDEIIAQLDSVKAKAVKIDGSLDGKVESMKARTEKMVLGLEKRLIKAQKSNSELALSQMHSVRDKILPNGTPQERVENFLSFYVKNRGEHVLDELINNISVIDHEVITVTW